MSGDQIPSRGGGGMLKLRFDWYITVTLFLRYMYCQYGIWRVPPQYWSMQFLFSAVYENNNIHEKITRFWLAESSAVQV